ncbi:iron-sulfur cluster insertion protein ErpA [Bermanella marisrubri]|uniref:Iron-sulfur cluster insertion protein ErpA n=1 Tax=Bermanella marisrubri TaxID=207949 RepID=Q1MXQ5_9GAMM|nr:iron-sulfur cluster insertion protein ErpA [Bermanella marisrubri]EAT10762.1 HesB/YadR/YfhF family protein [Oceanobacter sp. RED65] [Bermanella marisrubri]QIZ83089.1 iron-sulfur cluster insertion protein ErpA [Bermanella marisrubri]
MSEMSLTPAAVGKIQALIEDEGDDSLCLRVFVTGGGCSGFQYGFTFDTEVAEDDAQMQQDGVKVLVDSLSYPYLEGASVDYQENLEGSRFVVSNPQASTTCGCGSSFTI